MTPLPRVAACFSKPFSYRSDIATPSILSSSTHSIGSLWPASASSFSTRFPQTARSSVPYVFSIDIIGTRCRTDWSSGTGSSPTRCVGLSSVTRSGCLASSSRSSSTSRSYSRSLIAAAAST